MSDTCSYCKKNVPKCFLVCDNLCGRMWCSDLCADLDNGHHKNNITFLQKSIILFQKYVINYLYNSPSSRL